MKYEIIKNNVNNVKIYVCFNFVTDICNKILIIASYTNVFNVKDLMIVINIV